MTNDTGKSIVTLNTSALEKLVHDPQGVLAHEDDFWQQEGHKF